MPAPKTTSEGGKVARGRGRPRYAPTPEERQFVRLLAEARFDQVAIAEHIGVTDKTLRKYFADELDSAVQIVRARLRVARVKAAVKGNKRAAKKLLSTHVVRLKKQINAQLAGTHIVVIPVNATRAQKDAAIRAWEREREREAKQAIKEAAERAKQVRRLGRPAHRPTADTRAQVTAMSVGGMTPAEVASSLKLSVETLWRHYASEIEKSWAKVIVQVIAALTRLADNGDMEANGMLEDFHEQVDASVEEHGRVIYRLVDEVDWAA